MGLYLFGPLDQLTIFHLSVSDSASTPASGGLINFLIDSTCSYYSNVSQAVLGYELPLAYFLTGLAIYIYSFIATLRK